ncbi:DUF1203 domain-containing protein [Sneathiella limimaris]|uniref:DUF1203 domain-containing protein n=1 Tax=Sneathiella limimaris TaxID=1964213 RepID=UPI00146F109F|nr:DUF1203 domain-containing protein [Sneathiella limimaris]
MKNLMFRPIPTEKVRALQKGEPDAQNNIPEKHISDGDGLPCRHCLSHIAIGDEYLILSYKPFESEQPYAEQGPIFLHAEECPAYETAEQLPAMYLPEGQILLRGYSKDERIVYGTGQVIKNADIESIAEDIFRHPGVSFIHARSASNNCYQYRIEKRS